MATVTTETSNGCVSIGDVHASLIADVFVDYIDINVTSLVFLSAGINKLPYLYLSCFYHEFTTNFKILKSRNVTCPILNMFNSTRGYICNSESLY